MRLLILILFLSALSGLFAQEPGTPKRSFRLQLGGGMAREAYRDQAMSPLLYEGIQAAALLGVEVEGAKVLHRVEGQFWMGETTAQRRGGTTENIAFAVNGSYLRRLNPADDALWQWRAGPALLLWGSLRHHTGLVNSNYFYDFFASIGPTGSVERPFRFLRKRWTSGWQLSVPILSWGLRPTYSGLVAATPEEELTANPYLEEARTGTFKVLTRLQSRLHLCYALPNENTLMLVYHWDAFRSELGYHPVVHTMSGLQLNLSIKLSR